MQGMYANAWSHVLVGEGYSEDFGVKVGVHQVSVSPLLFIIVLEASSREFRSGVPWEDLYADDLVITAESLLEKCVRRLLTWKEAMEKKGLRVNAGKTKDHDMQYGPGPPAELGVSMHRLSHWSGQQQHLLQ